MLNQIPGHHGAQSSWDITEPSVTLLTLGVGTCCSVAQSCLTLCDPMDDSRPGFPVLHHFQGLPNFMSIESMIPSNHLILCCPLLLLPSIFPSITVFSNESALHIRWPKYWSFSFISFIIIHWWIPSNEYSGLISFRIDCFDLAVMGLSRAFSKALIVLCILALLLSIFCFC